MTDPFTPPHETPPNPKLGQLKIAAILLIVAGGLAALANIYFIFAVLFQAATGQIHPPETGRAGYESGYYAGFYSPLALGVIALPLLAVMIFGAIAMLRQRNYKMAKTGAILGIIPFTASCCCILTPPFGIWTLVLLNDSSVKAAFNAKNGPR